VLASLCPCRITADTTATGAESLHDLEFDLTIDLAGHLGTATVVDILHHPAGQADKVMMMIAIGAEVVIKLAVGVEDLADHPLGREFFEVAIDRRQPDLACCAQLYLSLHLLGAEVGPGGEHDIEDRQPLRRDLELQAFKELREIIRHEGLTQIETIFV